MFLVFIKVAYLIISSTNTNKSNGIPILNAIMCKNRRPGDKAKPDFDGLLGVGAWGRASGSRVEVKSTTPSPKQTILCKTHTSKSNGTALDLALLFLFFAIVQGVGGKIKSKIKSNTIRTVCVSFVLYRLFRGGLGRVCLNSRSRGPPLRPHPI